MSKSIKNKTDDDNLKQTKMGDYFSKDSSKPSEKKRKVATGSPKTSMWSSFWTRGAYRDTEEYRNKYPGKKDNEKRDENYRFYMNQIPSKPNGDFIDNIHANWYGDYKTLEIHHGYIQWLFPIRDTGMNWHAQELQLHEIEKLTKNRTAKKRILKSYKMMLNFYGMVLKNESTGEIERAENWKARFKHLNRSYHNYLRITRILKSLGEFDFEHLKANFVRFILYEGIVEQTLSNLIDSCVKYWIGVLRSDEERESVLDYYEELSEKQQTGDGKAKKKATSDSPEPVMKVKTGPSRYVHKYDSDSDSDQDAIMTQYDNMDLLADTLPFENNVDSDDDGKENVEKGDNKDKGSGTKNKGNLRILHDMSDSDPEDFKTPDIDESQEAGYWARNGKSGDGIDDGEEKEEEKNREIRDFLMGEEGEGDQEKEEKKVAGKSVIGKGGDTSDIEDSVNNKEVKSAKEDLCSDQIDDVISSKDKTVEKTEKKPKNDVEEPTQETCDNENKDKQPEQIAIDGVPSAEGTANGNDKSTAAPDAEAEEEEPMETGDDGNVHV